jgi:hypothetical protein
MLIEHRTYTTHPGKLYKQIESFEKYGLKIQTRHFGDPVAWLIPQTGDVNSYVHIWAFEDFADLEKKHAALVADPEWQAYLARSAESGYLVKQESKLMTPASFAPIKR